MIIIWFRVGSDSEGQLLYTLRRWEGGGVCQGAVWGGGGTASPLRVEETAKQSCTRGRQAQFWPLPWVTFSPVRNETPPLPGHLGPPEPPGL